MAMLILFARRRVSVHQCNKTMLSHLRLSGAICLLLVSFLFVTRPIAAQSLAYPDARRVDQVDTYHGVKVADPYRWMEDLASEELHAWLQAQDTLRADFLDNHRLITWIQKRIEALGHYAGQGLPTRRGNYTFTPKTEAGQSYGVLYVREEGQDQDRLLLDFEALRQRGTAFVNSFSPEGRYLTYYTTEGQSRWMEARVLRVADGETLPDLLTGIYTGGSSVAWTRGEEGFFYTRYPVPETPQDPLGRPQIFYHKVGTPQADDRLVYERPNESQLSLALRVTHDGRYLIVSGSESGGSFNGMYDRLFAKDLSVADAPMRELFPDLDAAVAFEGSHSDRFWIRTSHEAPQLRVVAVDPEQPDPAHWEEVIPNSVRHGHGFLNLARRRTRTTSRR